MPTNQQDPPHFRFWPDNLPRHLDHPPATMVEIFAQAAEEFSAKPFLHFYGSTMTYAESSRDIDALAGWLREAGVKRGDRVALNLQNSPQFVIGFFAILRADAVIVPVNPMSKREELEHYLADSDAKVAIAAQDAAPELAALIDTTPLRKILVATYSDHLPANSRASDFPPPEFLAAEKLPLPHPACTAWADAIAAAYKPAPAQAGASDLACLPYTSGSTGRPKACIHTHATLAAAARMFAAWENCGPETVALAPVPFFHVSGLTGTLNHGVLKGWTLVIMTRWDPALAARLIERYRVSRWNCLPTMVGDLLANPEAGKRNLASLRTISGGGAAMPAAVAQTLRETLGVELIEGYGMTEFMAATHINPPARMKAQCLGVPIFDVEAEIVDLESNTVLPSGMQGELVMRGPNMMQGYWKQPAASAEAFMEIDGRRFLRTGDVGYRDAEGYYFLNDRKKRMINAAGYKVWPVEVENFFYRHPALQECCIIATPDPRRGEQVKLVAVRKPGHESISPEDVIEWARERMANYKVPRQVEFVPALPRSGSGKILWRALQEKEFA
jgi:fatty-acyl-CoA synthase